MALLRSVRRMRQLTAHHGLILNALRLAPYGAICYTVVDITALQKPIPSRSTPMKALMPAKLLAFRVAITLSAFAMAVRGAIAPGYMPDQSVIGLGIFKLIICTADGLKTVSLEGAGSDRETQGHRPHDSPCPFAALGHLAIAEQLQFSSPIVFIAKPPLHTQTEIFTGPAFRAPGARAPPVG